MRVAAVGAYELLGETLDDAAGEAFDKTAQLLGLGYPGGPAIAQLAQLGQPGRVSLPRPMLHSGDLEFSFSGLKTAVLTHVRGRKLDAQARADVAAEFQAAIVDVLAAKSLSRAQAQWAHTARGRGRRRRQSRAALAPGAGGTATHCSVFYPAFEFCTDNGAMIAYAAAMRLALASPTFASAAHRFFSQATLAARNAGARQRVIEYGAGSIAGARPDTRSASSVS